MGKYFGTDGFRGEANKVLTVEHAFKIGRYLGWYFGQEHKAQIVIGKDTRRSSYMFEYALASASVQEMADFVGLAFDLAFKYRNPAMILADGVIGQMMEKVVLPEPRSRRTEEEVMAECPWATTGKANHRRPNIITSLELDPAEMEKRNIHLQQKYAEIEANEVRFEELHCEDAEYLIVAFGSCARIAQKAMEMAREQGIKVGLLRPITLWPFPSKAIAERAKQVKGILTVELNAGQMIEDVKLAVKCQVPVEHFGRLGGIVPDPDEVINALKEKLIK